MQNKLKEVLDLIKKNEGTN